MIKVHILNDKISYELFAYGIVSSNSIFQIVLDINKVTEYEFKIAIPVSNPKKTEKYSYPHGYFFPLENLHIHIFKNKHNGQVLFSMASPFDYIILIKGENIQETIQFLKESLRKVDNISMISKIELKKLKNLKEIFKTAE